MGYYNNVFTKPFQNGVCSIDANHNHNQYALECYDNSADEALAILSRGELREMADAIYAELGLGWLPYPKNKPKESDEFEVTALNQDAMKFVDMGFYATKDEKWYRAYAGNMEFYKVIAYRVKSTPYQP